jgi:Uma2 family endonuclease
MTVTTQRILAQPNAQILVDEALLALKDEFSKRMGFREWLDEDKKAEFINGQIIMHSPVKKQHWEASENLAFLIGLYTRLHDLGQIAVEKALIALTRNDYEPDICYFSKEKAAQFEPNQMLFPAPDFVVEILSKSTAKIDKTIKLYDYGFHGVKEYWIVDPIKQSVDQYVLFKDGNEFLPATTFRYGMDISSTVIKDFEIPVAAIFDKKINQETLAELMK